ncbi:MAG: FAD-dependent oxidoreductase [Xanthobacteraceae bacterium]
MSNISNHVAIIGAGMAGLAAAQRLGRSGIAVTLMDKSLGVGGRMSTRLIDGLQFDHGAQYFTARGDGFRAVVEQWRVAGLAAEWFDGGFVGSPGMTAPLRAMAAVHVIVGGCEVTALRRDERGWSVQAAGGPVETPGNGRFSAVILAVPAPQAVPLAASSGVALPELEAARYAPCWALMLGFSAPPGLRGDRIRPDDDVIGWIARDASKPGRKSETETVVVHAAPEWSRRNLEQSADAVARDILVRFRDITGIRAEPCFTAAHRWRHALVEQAAGPAFLWHEGARLGACGDWCLGPRVEAAFDSGDALAHAIVATLEANLVV